MTKQIMTKFLATKSSLIKTIHFP